MECRARAEKHVHHFKGLEDGSYAGVNILGGHVFGVLHHAEYAEGRETSRLPKRQEHNGLDGEQLEERFVWGELLGDGHI